MPTFYPPVPGTPVTVQVTLDQRGRTMRVTLPYTTTDQLEVRAIRREWAPREVALPGD